MNDSLLIAYLQADIEGDEDAKQKILALANDPDALKAAVQVEQKAGADADNTAPAESFR